MSYSKSIAIVLTTVVCATAFAVDAGAQSRGRSAGRAPSGGTSVGRAAPRVVSPGVGSRVGGGAPLVLLPVLLRIPSGSEHRARLRLPVLLRRLRLPVLRRVRLRLSIQRVR